MVATSNSKRILKNTFFMYSRMFLVMGVGLYTSRIILIALGIENYGIYTAVAGVVTFFSFISNSLTTALQRFYSYCIGENNTDKLQHYFNQGFWAFILIVGIVLLFSETIGLVVFNNLRLPEGKYYIALYVYQICVLNLIINIIRIPYNALIISHERMNFYAIMGIVEAILKLAAAYLIMLVSFDKLIFYMIYLFVFSLCINQITIYYCKRYIGRFKITFDFNIQTLKELFSFSGWTLLSAGSTVFSNQGITILINNAFGVFVTAAAGIATQVTGALSSFLSSFQISYNPQIIKLYAAKKFDEFSELMDKMSRFSFYLMMIIGIPVLIKMNSILSIWLKEVPEWSVQFCDCVMLIYLLESLTCPYAVGMQAIGKIKKYQISISITVFMRFVLALIFIKIGFSPTWAYLAKVFMAMAVLVVRTQIFHGFFRFSLRRFYLGVVSKSLLIFTLSFFILYSLSPIFEDVSGTLLFFLLSVFISGTLIFMIGLSKSEKLLVINYIRKYI